MKTLDQIHKEHGEAIMTISEMYLDAVLDDTKDTVYPYAQLLSYAMSDMGIQEDLHREIREYGDQILRENKAFDDKIIAYRKKESQKAQAIGKVVDLGQFSSRLMDAACNSIGLSYSNWTSLDAKFQYTASNNKGIKYQAKTASKLWELIKSEVQEIGDREILRNAKYSRGFGPCFSVT